MLQKRGLQMQTKDRSWHVCVCYFFYYREWLNSQFNMLKWKVGIYDKNILWSFQHICGVYIEIDKRECHQANCSHTEQMKPNTNKWHPCLFGRIALPSTCAKYNAHTTQEFLGNDQIIFRENCVLMAFCLQVMLS